MICLLMRIVAEDTTTQAKHATATAAACLPADSCTARGCCCCLTSRAELQLTGTVIGCNDTTLAANSSGSAAAAAASLYCVVRLLQLPELARRGVGGCSKSLEKLVVRMLFAGICDQ